MSDRHQQLSADLGHFRGPEGEPMVYAAQVHRRSLADLYYLARVRLVGQPQAGLETCELYGHEPAGLRCQRCGQPVR